MVTNAARTKRVPSIFPKREKDIVVTELYSRNMHRPELLSILLPSLVGKRILVDSDFPFFQFIADQIVSATDVVMTVRVTMGGISTFCDIPLQHIRSLSASS